MRNARSIAILYQNNIVFGYHNFGGIAFVGYVVRICIHRQIFVPEEVRHVFMPTLHGRLQRIVTRQIPVNRGSVQRGRVSVFVVPLSDTLA